MGSGGGLLGAGEPLGAVEVKGGADALGALGATKLLGTQWGLSSQTLPSGHWPLSQGPETSEEYESPRNEWDTQRRTQSG
jgi:hypothetical protein